jgi:tRNA threonylcarbamoyladenosine biosynthesis protein TsaE
MTAIRLADAAATEELGASLAPALRPGDVVALFGGLGAGKTTLARGILKGLGHDGDVASPTFPIVQVYEPPQVRIPLWHVDLYRIEHALELEELGIEDALADAALLIEWPERLPRLSPDALKLRLAPETRGGRILTAEIPMSWGDRWFPT